MGNAKLQKENVVVKKLLPLRLSWLEMNTDYSPNRTFFV